MLFKKESQEFCQIGKSSSNFLFCTQSRGTPIVEEYVWILKGLNTFLYMVNKTNKRYGLRLISEIHKSMLIENNIGFSIDPRRTPQGRRAERSHLLTPLRRVVSGTIAPQPVQCFPSDMLLIYWWSNSWPYILAFYVIGLI